MGWTLRFVALLVGFVAFGAGVWLLSLLCFLYLAISFRPRRSKRESAKEHRSIHIPVRQVFAGALLALSAVALASGGVLSPMILVIAGLALLLWPMLLPRLRISEVVPLGNSILLRSKYSPIGWCAIAELKPGAEPFPRAVSSFTGTLLVFMDTGRACALVACHSLGRREAETKLLSRFKFAAPSGGAYLLPLDSESAADVLRVKLSRTKLPAGDLAESASRVSGLLVLDCHGGRVSRAGAFEVEGASASSSLPGNPTDLESPPLTWEVLDTVGKRTKWPDPDSFSDLLDSMTATRGVPVGERIREMDGSGSKMTVHTLSGEEVQLSRPQLRAILTVYS